MEICKWTGGPTYSVWAIPRAASASGFFSVTCEAVFRYLLFRDSDFLTSPDIPTLVV